MSHGYRLPAVVAHGDWAGARGRALAVAELQADGAYQSSAFAIPSGGELLGTMRALANGRPVLLGFDFPIGLPTAYAMRASVDRFPAWLAAIDGAAWDRFRVPAAAPAEIGADRPFYPLRPGGSRRTLLAHGHGVAGYAELLRRCDGPTGTRPAACCMFWTLGPQQCGRAALAGWHEVIRPALRAGDDLALWPFDGDLEPLLAERTMVVAETYPTEFYRRLGIARPCSKRRQGDRQQHAAHLAWLMDDLGIRSSDMLAQQLADGFGPRPDGENPFDALIGLIGLLLVLRGRIPATLPDDPVVRAHEGWMLGLDPDTLRSVGAQPHSS